MSNLPPRPEYRRPPPRDDRRDDRRRYPLPPPPHLPPGGYYPPPRYDDYRGRDSYYSDDFRRSRFDPPIRRADAWVPNEEYAEKERQERERAVAAREDGEDDSRHYVPSDHRQRPRGRPSYYSRSRSPPPLRRPYPPYPPRPRRSPPPRGRRTPSPPPRMSRRRRRSMSRSRSRSYSRSPSRSRSPLTPPRSSIFRLGNRPTPERIRHPSPPPLITKQVPTAPREPSFTAQPPTPVSQTPTVAPEVKVETPPAPAPASAPVPEPPTVDKGKQKASEDVVMRERSPSPPPPPHPAPPTVSAPVLLLPRSVQAKVPPRGPRSHTQPLATTSTIEPESPAAQPSPTTSAPSPASPMVPSLPPKPTTDILVPNIQRKPTSPIVQSPVVPPPPTAPVALELKLSTSDELNKHLIAMNLSLPAYIPPIDEPEVERHKKLGLSDTYSDMVKSFRFLENRISERVPERRKRQTEKRQALFELEMAMLDVKAAEKRTKASGLVLSELLDEGDVGLM